MARRVATALALIAALLAAAAGAAASGGFHASLTAPIPAGKFAGDRVVIAWKLRDGAGQPANLQHVVVKIVCPEGTDFTTADAVRTGRGAYRAVAVVPPGGIGTVTMRAKGTTVRLAKRAAGG